MKWIQEFFISYYLKKNQPNKPENWTKSIEDIKSIHILADSYEDLAVSEAAIRSCWPKELEIKKVHYSETTREEGCFSSKSFSLFGKPKQELEEFLNSPSDVFLTTITSFNVFQKYMVVRKKAGYRIGFYRDSRDVPFEIMLTKEGLDLENNVSNLLKYLKKII